MQSRDASLRARARVRLTAKRLRKRIVLPDEDIEWLASSLDAAWKDESSASSNVMKELNLRRGRGRPKTIGVEGNEGVHWDIAVKIAPIVLLDEQAGRTPDWGRISRQIIDQFGEAPEPVTLKNIWDDYRGAMVTRLAQLAASKADEISESFVSVARNKKLKDSRSK